LIAIFISLGYIYYINLTIRNDVSSIHKIDDLFISKIVNMKPRFRIIILQMALSLVGILYGAERFVESIESISGLLNIPPVVLSLFLTPIATELPEKFNSVIWIRKNRDSLALGNITGAMVFQSCIPVSLGIVATSWRFDRVILASAVLALSSSLILYLAVKTKRDLELLPLFLGGAFYIVYLIIILKYIF
jgi:cation:H+ antiporter